MYNESHLRRSWVEIDTDQLIKNYKIFRDSGNFETVIAVIKADAYGHSDCQIAKILNEQGVAFFAVSNIEEAMTLRNADVKGEILILGYTPVEYAGELKKYDITQALIDETYADALANKGIKAQFAIDTGMNRIGLDAADPEQCEKTIRKFSDRFNLTGIFSHLCVADTDNAECKEFTETQISQFDSVVERLKDLRFPYIHCLNSAGGLFYKAKNPYNSIARLGIILYGLKPDYLNKLPCGVFPVMTWKSVIAMVKNVHVGESIGYGRTFIADHEMQVATIPTGYADGYRRELSNKGKVLVGTHYAYVVGRVCMDQLMIDVTGLDVNRGDEVILMGKDYTADDMAKDIGTISYEIVCGISKRVPRRYYGGNNR